MTPDAPAPSKPRARPPGRLARRIGVILLIALIGATVLLAVAWLNRREAARQVLVGWLDRRGIEAEVEVERLELDGVVARVRVGPADDPDVVVDRVEVDYALGLPWSATGFGPTPSRIRLVRPVVRATWTDGVLSFNSLDPLIQEFRARPPRPDARAPVVIVEAGRLRVAGDYGALEVLGNARLEDNRLMRLQARMPSADLAGGGLTAQDLSGSIDLTSDSERTRVVLDLVAASATQDGRTVRDARLTGRGDLPYPRRLQGWEGGAARVDLALTAASFQAGASEAGPLTAEIAFDGTVRGWIEAFRLDGRVDAEARARTLRAPDLEGRQVRLSIDGADLDLARGAAGMGWRLAGPARLDAARTTTGGLQTRDLSLRSTDLTLGGRDGDLEATGPLAISAGQATFGTLTMQAVSGRMALDAMVQGPVRVLLSGDLATSQARWPLLGAPSAEDVPELAEMKRAFDGFSLTLPGLAMEFGSGGTQVRLRQAARIVPANGGILTIREGAGAAFGAAPGARGGGTLRLVAERGAGLPQATIEVPQWGLTADGIFADLDARAALDFGVARGLSLSTRGRLTSTAQALTYVTTDCAPFTVERLELGENDAEGLAGRLCPAAVPLARVAGDGWTADGRIADLSAALPFLMMRAEDAALNFRVRGRPGDLALDAEITAARLIDTAEPRRLYDLTARGRAALAADQWTASLDLSRDGTSLGVVDLRHQARTGVGGVRIDAPGLVFAQGGLQPDALSPLAADWLGSPVTGRVAFQGRFDWTGAEDEATSSGLLIVDDLSFTSPAGPAEGLSGEIRFDSLAPLDTAPGQRLTLRRLDAFSEFRDLDLTFELDAASIRVDGGSIATAGGTVSLEPFSLPLDRTQPFEGVIVLDRVQLGDILTQAGLGDRVTMDAVVSGRLPFVYDPVRGLRVNQGSLAAVQPGRLSIRREALDDIQAGGGGDIPPNAVEDLAYQAMENLAFDILSAEVNSLDEGRLGVLFRIRGRHDPPQRQELRVGLAEFISRRFLQRELPLPSDTGIDLTLDTTLNANQLFSDLLELNRARSGQADAPSP